MILALCVDNRMGLMFQNRRLSKDAVLRERLLDLSGGHLRMSPYSAKQFDCDVYAGDDYLSGSAQGEWCFVENDDYAAHADEIEKIVLFRWNRDYPADLYFAFPGEWNLVSGEEFPGRSHDMITMEVYEK